MKEEVRVTVIATGFERADQAYAPHHDGVIRPDFRAQRPEVRPLSGSRTVLPEGGPAPFVPRTGREPTPFQPRAPEREPEREREAPAAREGHGTPITRLPVPPRPAERPSATPNDLEIPTFIRRQMD
jgi:cell division protein FtsZ